MKIYITVFVLITILGVLFIYEKKKTSLMDICICATLSAIAGVSRVFFAGIPGLQPVTFIVIMTGFVFGPFLGFLTGVLATLVSNFFLGHGPWTIWQMFAWGLAGASAGVFSKFIKNPNKYFFMAFTFIWGFLFGWIMNLWHFLYFVNPQNMQTFISTMALSFYFDLIHSVGNMAFSLVASMDMMNILIRFRDRLTNYSYGE